DHAQPAHVGLGEPLSPARVDGDGAAGAGGAGRARRAPPRRARLGARARPGARARRGGAAPARLGSARAPPPRPRGHRAARLPAPGAPGAPAPRPGRSGGGRRARGLHDRARPPRHGARPRGGERRDRMKEGPSAAALALAWGVVVAVFWGGLVVPSMQPGLRRPMDIDLYGYFVPKFWYGNAELGAGRLPLWNPYEYGGLPFLGAAQPAALYPPKIAVYALAGRAATHAYMALHYLLAGGFAFVALRGLGLGWPGAALGTVTWAFSPLNLESHYHPVRLACLTWVPLVLLAFVRLLERPGLRAAAALAGAAALTLLGGYPEYALDTGVCLLVFWLVAGRRLGPRDGRALGWLAASGLLAAALVALQVVSLLEMAGESARAARVPAAVTAPHLADLAVLGDPRVLGALARSYAHWFHLAPLAWMLAVVAGGVCLASAVGVGARSWPWLALGLGLLAVARASAAWRTPAVLALVACVTWALWAWNPASFTRPSPHRFSRGEPPYPPEPPRATGFGAQLARRCGPGPARVLAPGLIWDGAAISERVELVQGYPESIAPGRMQRLLGELGLDPERSLLPDWERVGARGRLLDLLNVGCVLVPAGARLDAERLELAPAGGLGDAGLYRRAHPLPR